MEWESIVVIWKYVDKEKKKTTIKKGNDNGSDVNMLSERKHNVYYITKELRWIALKCGYKL